MYNRVHLSFDEAKAVYQCLEKEVEAINDYKEINPADGKRSFDDYELRILSAYEKMSATFRED